MTELPHYLARCRSADVPQVRSFRLTVRIANRGESLASLHPRSGRSRPSSGVGGGLAQRPSAPALQVKSECGKRSFRDLVDKYAPSTHQRALLKELFAADRGRCSRRPGLVGRMLYENMNDNKVLSVAEETTVCLTEARLMPRIELRARAFMKFIERDLQTASPHCGKPWSPNMIWNVPSLPWSGWTWTITPSRYVFLRREAPCSSQTVTLSPFENLVRPISIRRRYPS
jgi:hypothetical protein